METRELIKREIDKIDDSYLDLVFQMIHVIESYSEKKKVEKSETDSVTDLNSIFKFYNSSVFDMSQFHLNREEVNER